jgi:predicted kinase
VRGKVEGLKRAEREVPPDQRDEALAGARAHWLLALGELEEPVRRPGLLLVAGLPGSGKSTLARRLAEQAGFTVIRSDVVRKELTAGAGNEDIYTPQWSDQTYAECLRRAEAVLFEGGRALIDANFREERSRRAFLDHAVRWGVPALFLVCQVEPDVARARLRNRRGDVSDAGWTTYQQLRASWEEPGVPTRRHLRVIRNDGPPEETLAQVLAALRETGLQ